MATLDILGLDPSSPPLPLPPVVAAKPAVRKPAATAMPLNVKPAASPSTSSSSSSSAKASPPPASGAGSLAYTEDGTAYTVPISVSTTPFHRGRWTESQLLLRSGEFTETRELTMFVGSWNVNAKKPKDERDLSAWLLHRIRVKGEKAGAAEGDEESGGEEDGAASAERRFAAPDIYVVGFQEIVDLNAGNLLVDHNASRPWEDFILDTLARTGRTYVKVTTVHLVGISLCIFVKDKHLNAVTDVRVDEVGTGFAGVGGNKGAVLVKLRLYKTVFVFINSHLAAHQGAVKARNADFWSIIRRASFEGARKARVCDADGEWHDQEAHRRRNQQASGASSGVDNFAASASSFFDSMVSKSKVIMDNVNAKKTAGANGSSATADDSNEDGISSVEDLEAIRRNPHGIFYGTHHIVWLGDNNYRLNVAELGLAATVNIIEQEDYPRLLQYDQLLQEKRAKNSFIGFIEPRIEFKPTYKFITGTSEYDQRPDKKLRLPAYTDRIQYMTCKPTPRAASLAALTNPGELVLNSLHALYYTSTWKLMASDHKPVMMLLDAPVLFERVKSRAKILADLEQLTNEECAPRIHISTTQLDFGTVCFDYAVTRSFVLRNVGDAVVAFRLMNRITQPQQGHLGDVSLTKPWLRIIPTSGLLARGQTQTVHVTMHVTSRNGAAQLLNSEAESLVCDLMLRLDGGQQYKVHLDAEYEKSICGSELSYLNALPCKNIRKAVPEDVVNNEESYSVPQFLFKIIDFMTEKKQILKLKQNAFGPPAYEQDDEEEDEEDAQARKRAAVQPRADQPQQQVCTHAMRWIFDYLDTGRSLDKEPKDPSKWKCPAAPAPTESPAGLPASAFVHALLYWLSSLPSPLLVASPSQRWVTGMDLTAWCYQTLLETEVEKYRTLVYVLTFTREIVAHHRLNGCNVLAFSSLLGVALCHRTASSALSPIMPISPANIVQHLLTSPDFAKLPQDNSEHQQAQLVTAAPVTQARGRYADIQ